MTDRVTTNSNEPPASGRSITDPYLRVRELSQQTSLAYSLLIRQRDRSDEVVGLIDELVTKADRLLDELGLLHSLGVEVVTETECRGNIISAFATAHRLWAEVLAGIDRLAEEKLSTGMTDDALRLAAYLKDLGLSSRSKQLMTSISNPQKEALDRRKRLSGETFRRFQYISDARRWITEALLLLEEHPAEYRYLVYSGHIQIALSVVAHASGHFRVVDLDGYYNFDRVLEKLNNGDYEKVGELVKRCSPELQPDIGAVLAAIRGLSAFVALYDRYNNPN